MRPALVAAIFLVAMFQVSSGARAEDLWGCEVLLCLSNPSGPTAVPECVPPITRLWDHLRHGGAFPSCEMATGPNGRSWAQMGWTYYDACPAGTTALAPRTYAVQGSAAQLMRLDRVVYTGIGSGDGLQPARSSEGVVLNKICVGDPIGKTWVIAEHNWAEANIYDRVVSLPPQWSPNVIDVFIDNRLWRRVRW
jgi:hypothetical protein